LSSSWRFCRCWACKMSTTDTIVIAGDANSTHSYMEWGAVVAGAFVASALSLVLFTFGGGVGLSISSPFPGQGAANNTLSYLTMAWVLIVMIFSFIAGGYIAGRLRRPSPGATEDSIEFRDGAHGLVVWATGLLIGAALSAHISAAATSSGVDEMARTYDANVVLRDVDADADDRMMLTSILSHTTAEGELSDMDRAIAVQFIADNSQLSEAEARSRVEQWEAGSRDAADRARKVGAISAFLLAASALVAGAGAYFAGGIGGRHRDANAPFPWTRARAVR